MSDEYRWDNEKDEVVEDVMEEVQEPQEAEEDTQPQIDMGYAPRYDYDYSQVVVETKPVKNKKKVPVWKIVLIGVLVVAFAILAAVGFRFASYFTDYYFQHFHTYYYEGVVY